MRHRPAEPVNHDPVIGHYAQHVIFQRDIPGRLFFQQQVHEADRYQDPRVSAVYPQMVAVF